MTITKANYRKQDTAALEAALDALSEYDNDDDAELYEAIEDELFDRELEAELPSYDSPSLADTGLTIGSYAS